MNENVEHPPYYGGKSDPYEPIKVIRAWGLCFELASTLKYIKRAGKKCIDTEIEDLEKGRECMSMRIEFLKEQKKNKINN